MMLKCLLLPVEPPLPKRLRSLGGVRRPRQPALRRHLWVVGDALPCTGAIAMILEPFFTAPIRDLMNTTALPDSRTTSLSKDRTVVGALTLILGLGFVYFVGFAPLSAVHNAAHDTRHSAAFPCH